MKIKIIQELKIVGFRVLCPGDQYEKEIRKAEENLEQRKKEINHAVNPDIHIGAFIAGETSPNKEGYWLGIEVEKIQVIPDEMTSLSIPVQKYASMIHLGPSHKIRDSYEMLHQWIEKQGLKRSSDGWNLEFCYEGEAERRIEICDSVL